MANKRKGIRRTTTIVEGSVDDRKRHEVPATSAPALMSFLKQVSVEPFWDEKRIAQILNVKTDGAAQIAATLEMLGYAEVVHGKKALWRNTEAGKTVSGAKPPRFNRDSVLGALDELRTRAEGMNADHEWPFRVTDLIAFGDFLDNYPKVQPADVGVGLVPKRPNEGEARTARGQKREEHVLRGLRAKSTMVQLHALEGWMRKRAHRDVLART